MHTNSFDQKSDQKSEQLFSLLSLFILDGEGMEVMWRQRLTSKLSSMIQRHITANLL